MFYYVESHFEGLALIKENLCWSVGNEISIRCWIDSWIPEVGLLIDHIPVHVNINLDGRLSKMVTEEHSWNLEFFCLWLLEEIIRSIMGIPPPHSFAGPDGIIWARTSNGFFFLKIAYWHIWKRP